MLLHDVLTDQMATAPDKPAVIDADDDRAVTYGQLADMANGAASRLRAAGLKPGDVVAVVAKKSPEVIAMFLGASQAGVIFVPLDPATSANYRAGLISDFGIGTVLTNIDGTAGEVPALVRVLPIGGGDDTAILPASPSATAHRLPAETAYILSTSGSTGRPKGVVLSHRNALSFADWAADHVALGPGDCVLGVAPFHFDLSVFDIYATLMRGATLVLAPSMAAVFPGALIQAIETHSVSVVYTVPSVLRTLVGAGAFDGDMARSLKTVIYAGEPYPTPSLVELMSALPHVSFHNFFGPTETNVSLAHRFTATPSPEDDVPIGSPASGASISLVDGAGGEVEAGEIGEIAVDGPTVMQGYLTGEGFQPAPRPYFTGDFARKDEAGHYYFCGRRDQQVKVRGVRIELQAVANALLSVRGMAEAAALVIEGKLVAFYASEEGVVPEDLQAACRERLPPGAAPSAYVALETMPRLSNGKLDLVALREAAAKVVD